MVDFFLFFFPSNGGYYLLVLFGLWSFCFSLDRSSGVGSSLSPSRAMVLLFFFYLFIFFSWQEVIGKRHRRVTSDSWRGFLFSPSTVEARSMSIRRSQHDTLLSMVFA